jgi:hypothetical protein
MNPVPEQRRMREPFWKVGIRVSVIAFVGGVYFSITGSWRLAVAAFVVGAAFALAAWKSAGRQERAAGDRSKSDRTTGRKR